MELLCDRARLAADTIDGKTEQRIAFYDQALQERLIRETQMRNQVQQALEDRQFHLYVQPKVDMRTGEVIGAESLIRWIHPEFGFIPPDQFIPLLEEAGEIYPLDKYVWEDTCRLLQQRQKAGKKVFPISVNVARGDLYQKDLQQTLQSLLQKYELSAATLHLEVTERAYVHDSQHIFHVLSELREAGFFIEMDDFGTGESSLAMVAEMPIDLLKLDRYFLVSAAHSKRHAEIIHFIIQLAQSLDLHILAFSLRLHQRTVYADTRTCRYRLQKFFAQLVHVYNDLNIIYCRTVIQGDETNLFTTTAGTDPSFHVNGRTESFAFQYVYNFCSFNCFHVYIFILR